VTQTQFARPAGSKVVKVWLYDSGKNQVAYALVEGAGGLSTLYSYGQSDCGMLGQGANVQESKAFTSLKYDPNGDSQF